VNIPFMILAGILIVGAYIGVNFYIAKRLYGLISYIFPRANAKLFAGIYTAFAIPVIIGLTMPRLAFGYAMRVVGSYWAGIFFYLLMLLLIADLAILLGRLSKLIPANTLKKVRFYAGTAVVVLTAAISAYGLINARQFRIAEYEIQLRRPLEGEPMNIVFISDLHLGEVHTERWLERLVNNINALNPDVVAIVGDIFNDDFYKILNPARAEELLRSINATFGVFACLGNHDAGPTLGSMLAFLYRSDITVLSEDFAVIDDRLILIGRLDPYPSVGDFGDMSRQNLSYILAEVPNNLPIVVIDHNPINIPEYNEAVDLVLFGHTHRGQMFPINLITRAMYVIHHGHLPQTETTPHVIVTQGVHTWLMPMRVGTNNEIARVVVR